MSLSFLSLQTYQFIMLNFDAYASHHITVVRATRLSILSIFSLLLLLARIQTTILMFILWPDHYDEIFYICLFFGIAVMILIASIMIVFGRLMWSKRSAGTSDSTAISVSELSTTVDTMSKYQSGDTIVVTSHGAETQPTTNISSTNANTAPAFVPLATKDEASETTSDIDLPVPLSIPSISNRNNVSRGEILQKCVTHCIQRSAIFQIPIEAATHVQHIHAEHL